MNLIERSNNKTTPQNISRLYDIYAPSVYAIISGIISEKNEAEAVLLKIFCGLSVEMEKYNHRDSLLLWLINLSRNECITRLISENEGTKTKGVNTYVNKLPVLEKTIFALVYLKGLDMNEVAILLQLPLKRIEGVFTGMPKFTPYLFPNIKRKVSPISDMLPSLMRNLIPEVDELRVAALNKYEILYTPAEAVFDRITQIVSQVFETPLAFLSLVDEDTVFYKSQVGTFGKWQVKREHSLCSLTILSREPLVIEDASLESCFKDNPFVQAEGGIKFYAGSPLITRDGYMIGALSVVDTKTRTFSSKDTLLLSEFAELAMLEIESRHDNFQQLLFEEQLGKI